MRDYFSNFEKGINNAQMVEQSTWKIFDAPSASILTLSGTAPTDPFKLAITARAVTGHTDCAGSITVGDEILTFTAPTRKTTTAALTALPVIATCGLDCHVLIECISTSGAPLYKEVLTPIEIVCFPHTELMRDPSGSGWIQLQYKIFTRAALNVGDQIRYTDPFRGGQVVDMYCKRPGAGVDLTNNSEAYRVMDCA